MDCQVTSGKNIVDRCLDAIFQNTACVQNIDQPVDRDIREITRNFPEVCDTSQFRFKIDTKFCQGQSRILGD